MASEYHRLLPEHITYTQKNLLQAQIDSLMSLKNLHAYKQLRQDELVQKIRLKKLIEETKQEIDVLLKMLPEPIRAEGEAADEDEGQASKRSLIEDELEILRQKIEQLQ